jgi:hypothetical protein
VAITDPGYMRETDMVCERCGRDMGQWDTSISLETAAARIVTDSSVLDGLFTRSCWSCGHRVVWDAAIVPGSGRGTLSLSRQRRLIGTLRRLLRERAEPEEVAATVRRMYEVEAFYVQR